MNEITAWQQVLSGCFPVFINVETTGVGSDDVVSAVCMRPPAVSTPVLLSNIWSVPDDKVATAAKFLAMTENEYRELAGVPQETFVRIFDLLLEEIAKRNMTPLLVTYNPEFQARFLGTLVPGALEAFEWLDICRLAWCLSETNGISPDIGTVQELMSAVTELTNGQRGTGYKPVMTKWGLPVSSPCPPLQKTARIAWMWNKVSHWKQGVNPIKLPYATSLYPEVGLAVNLKAKSR